MNIYVYYNIIKTIIINLGGYNYSYFVALDQGLLYRHKHPTRYRDIFCAFISLINEIR